MNEKLPIWDAGTSSSKCRQDDNSSIIGLEFEVFGEPVEFHIGFSDDMATLSDIVPAARKFSTQIALKVLGRLRRDGFSVPCCKGCSSCCSYLIPLSVPEVFRLRQEIMDMPENRARQFLDSCLEASKKILSDRLEDFNQNGRQDYGIETFQQRQNRVGNWYRHLNIQCPFLSQGLCDMYPERPMACREHIVTGLALNCGTDSVDRTGVVKMPFSVLDILAKMTADLEGSEVEAVMLPLALPWAQENLARGRRKWPAEQIVHKFLEIIKQISVESPIALHV